MRISDWSSDVCSSDLTHRWIDLCALFMFDVGRAPLTFGLTGRRRNRTGVADILRVLPVGFILIALFAKVACLTGLELFQIGPFLCLLLFVVPDKWFRLFTVRGDASGPVSVQRVLGTAGVSFPPMLCGKIVVQIVHCEFSFD